MAEALLRRMEQLQEELKGMKNKTKGHQKRRKGEIEEIGETSKKRKYVSKKAESNFIKNHCY